MVTLKTNTFRSILILTSVACVYFIGKFFLTDENDESLIFYWGTFTFFLLLHIFICWNEMKEKFNQEKDKDDYETLWHASFQEKESENIGVGGVISSYIFFLFIVPVPIVLYGLPFIYSIGGFLISFGDLFGLMIVIIFYYFVFRIIYFIGRFVTTHSSFFIKTYLIILVIYFIFGAVEDRPIQSLLP